MAGYLGYLKNRVETSLLPRACPPVPAQVLNSATAGVSFTLMQERSRRSTGQLVGRSCPRPFQPKYDRQTVWSQRPLMVPQSVIISGVNFSFQNSRPTSQSYITLRPWSVVSPLVFTGHLHSQSRPDMTDEIPSGSYLPLEVFAFLGRPTRVFNLRNQDTRDGPHRIPMYIVSKHLCAPSTRVGMDHSALDRMTND